MTKNTEPASGLSPKETGVVKLLYGHLRGQPSWTEQILSSQPERFQEVKLLASRDGFVGFRIATHKDGALPDFAGTIR